MSTCSQLIRLLTIVWTASIIVAMSDPAAAQARWLNTKTKPFTSGKSVTEVLSELGEAHKIMVVYADADAKSELDSFSIHGNLEGLPLSASINLIVGHLLQEGAYPWTADKTTLTIGSGSSIVSVTYDISQIGRVLNDADEFRYAIEAVIDAPWEDPEMPSSPEEGAGSIESLSANAVTIRQSAATHQKIADLLNKLQAAAGGTQKEEKSTAEKKMDKLLEKQMSLGGEQMTWDELLKKVFSENKAPYLVTQSALEVGFDPTAIITPSAEKQKLHDSLQPLLSEHKVKLSFESGAVLITSAEQDSGGYSLQVYNILRYLNTSTPAEVSAKLIETGGLKIDDPVVLGPFLIVDGTDEDHKKISQALNGR